jgi:hypothetical protein
LYPCPGEAHGRPLREGYRRSNETALYIHQSAGITKQLHPTKAGLSTVTERKRLMYGSFHTSSTRPTSYLRINVFKKKKIARDIFVPTYISADEVAHAMLRPMGLVARGESQAVHLELHVNNVVANIVVAQDPLHRSNRDTLHFGFLPNTKKGTMRPQAFTHFFAGNILNGSGPSPWRGVRHV